MVKKEPRDHIGLLYTLTGAGAVQQFGRHADLRSGGAAFCYSDEPTRIHHGPWSQIALHVDRRVTGIPDSDLRAVGARRIDDSDSPSLRILRRIAEELLGPGSAVSPAEWEAISHAVMVLMRGVVTSAAGAPPNLSNDLAESPFLASQAAIMHMRRYFADPQTTPQTVADRLHISRRHLYRVFDAAGTTPSSYLRDLRLAHATRLLQDGCPVDVAARRSGFSSSAAFRRAFKQKHGAVPSQARRPRREGTES